MDEIQRRVDELANDLDRLSTEEDGEPDDHQKYANAIVHGVRLKKAEAREADAVRILERIRAQGKVNQDGHLD